LYPWLNTAEDEKRRVAARWALTHWQEYQEECARRREAPTTFDADQHDETRKTDFDLAISTPIPSMCRECPLLPATRHGKRQAMDPNSLARLAPRQWPHWPSVLILCPIS